MDKYGIEVAKPNKTLDSGKADDKAVSSEFNCLKVKLGQNPTHFGQVSYTFASNPGNGETLLFSKQHAYGYRPAHIVFFEDDLNFYSFCPLPGAYGTSNQLYAKCDTDKLYVYISRVNSEFLDLTGSTWIFKYYIFAELGA